MVSMVTSLAHFGLISCWICLCYSHLSLEVDSLNGKDSSECLESNSPIPCQSLEFVVKHYNGFSGNTAEVVITITSSSLTLRNPVHLSNVSHFTLQGQKEGVGVISKVTCQAVEGGASEAGLFFINSFDIILQNFIMESCTSGSSSLALPFGVGNSLTMFGCLDISIVNVSISLSCGHGLVLINSEGNVLIENCSFVNNSYSLCSSGWDEGSGGLFVLVNDSIDYRSANYIIRDCGFINNSANTSIKTWQSFANHGGGISVNFLKGAINNNLKMTNCNFNGNIAALGGGTNFRFDYGCHNNSIAIQDSTIESNRALFGGGGGNTVFNQDSESMDGFPFGNSVHFVDCIIKNNTAIFGGGIALHMGSPNNFDNFTNNITFESCKFIENTANGGAAIDINRAVRSSWSSGGRFLIASSYFRDCLYSKNKILESKDKITQNGIFFTSNVHTHFEGHTCFESNTGTALYISKTHVHFANCTTHFRNNIGFKGGAVGLIGEASLQLSGDNKFTFENNSASFGGAICAERLPIHHTNTCFIEIKRKNSHKSYNSFTFINNKATTGIANDIFVSNLQSCRYYYSCSGRIFNNTCVGNFTFSDSTSSNNKFATSVSDLTIEDPHIDAFPGIPVTLNITQRDEFGADVGKIFSLFAYTGRGSPLSVDKNYTIIKLNQTMFTGKQGVNGTLIVQTDSITVLKAFATVQLLPCPHGFNFNEKTLKCECFVNEFIFHCEINRAVIKKGYWIGNLGTHSSSYIGFGNCDYRICDYDKGQYQLGSNVNLHSSLDVCASMRTGTLCGLCLKGYTVYYHSPKYICHKESEACLYGPVMYFLSETLPVTVLFLVIIFFNIHLTSGPLYSFIFYAQSLDILGVDAYGTVQYEGLVNVLLQFYKIFYGFFNLNVLNSESLSFCLKKRMNILDTYLVQYCTIIYSLLLIVFTLLVLKVNSRFSCSKLCLTGRRNTQSSVINGLTAFVVMCYFKCIHISYHSNVPVDLFVNGKRNRTVVLFNGEYEYLRGGHLKYAVLALLVFIFIILPLPLLLILESVLMKLNRLAVVQRCSSREVLFSLRLKVLPFLDSFQGCFKDSCRCFAGFYFLYRTVLLSSYLYANHIEQIYIATEITFLIILSMHLAIQPFHHSWHNKLDIFLLANIALVNFITLNQYYRITLIHGNKHMLNLFAWIQVFFMTLPFLYFITYTCYKINIKYCVIKKICKRFKGESSLQLVESTTLQ